MLIDLQNKIRSVERQSALPDGNYDGDVFSFEIIDRVTAESYAILRADIQIFGALDAFKSALMLLNAAKQRLIMIMAMGYRAEARAQEANYYRESAQSSLPRLTLLFEQIERSLKEKFGIENPYKAV